MRQLLRRHHRRKPPVVYRQVNLSSSSSTESGNLVPIAEGSAEVDISRPLPPFYEPAPDTEPPQVKYEELTRTSSSREDSATTRSNLGGSSPLLSHAPNQPSTPPQAVSSKAAEEDTTDTYTVLEPYSSHKPIKPTIPPSTFLDPVSDPNPPSVDASPGLGTRGLQRCEACDLDHPMVWFCGVCNFTYCDQCWNGQPVHRKNRGRPGATPHEKTGLEVAEKVGKVLTPLADDGQREELHRRDELTAWFGIERQGQGKKSRLMLQDYGRLLDLLSDRTSNTNQSTRDRMTPSLVSFVGETGAGKSSLIKLLIDLETTSEQNHSTPVIGPCGSHLPTSEDVHLYLDPGTAQSSRPIMLVDCEGLEGGEREPSGAKSKRKSREDDERYARLNEDFFKAQRLVREYELQWSVGAGSKTRGFAVTHLYPRLLYAFSDVIVFVLRNARVIEQVFEKLVTWAVNVIETSSNQPILPHAIIVLNNHEDYAGPGYTSLNTSDILQDVSHIIELNKTFATLARFWRERGKPIRTLSELLLCYYSSIEILRVPGKDRPRLVHDRVKQLRASLSKASSAAQTTRGRAGMLLDVDDLQIYMQEAFTVFSERLESSFDFTRASLRNSRIPADFGGNILKLLRGVVDIWKNSHMITARHIFSEVNFIIASCIMLDTARRRDKGSPSDIFPKYLTELEDVLEAFCNQWWPCEARNPKTGARCVNTSFGHAKGHQSKDGKVFSAGDYESEFTFNDYREEFLRHVYVSLQRVCTEVTSKVNSLDLSQQRAAADVHQSIIRSFFWHTDPADKRPDGVGPLTSHSTCFCCLLEPGEHPLPCGHLLCTTCVTTYGKRRSITEIQMLECPIGSTCRRWSGPQTIRLKPKSAGVRVMALDGGGIRGIAELEILRQIEQALGGRLPIQAFFDLIVGTSTGGLVALGLAVMGWSVDYSIARFEELCTKAFTKRLGSNIPLLGSIIEGIHHSRYQTAPLQLALQNAFSKDNLLFGGHRGAKSSIPAVKVAVTSFSLADKKTYILSNYNRPGKIQNPTRYHFHRPETSCEELKIWEAARATSAAPQYFKNFCHRTSQKTYLDGAMFYNNPVQIADAERSALWPDVDYPDIMLSLGTGCSPDDKMNKSRPLGPKRGVVSHWHHLVELLKMNMEATLDCDEAWGDYHALVKSGTGRLDPPKPMFRINPNVPTRLPALDDWARMGEFHRQVSESLAGEPQIAEVASQLVASSFHFQLCSLEDGYGGRFLAKGELCCKLSQWASALGAHIKQRTTIQGPLRLVIRNDQMARAPLACIELSGMLDAMTRKEQFAQPCSFTIKSKTTPIQMRLQFGDDETSSCFISGFPRSLLPDSNPRERPRSSPTDARSRSSSRRPNRTLNWKPPEHQGDLEFINIRRYTNPSRKLGYQVAEQERLARERKLLKRPLFRETIRERHIVRQLTLNAGTDPNTVDHRGWSRLHLAIFEGNMEVAKAILAAGRPDINLKDRRGRTVLHIAALGGDSEAIDLLQSYGAKNTRDQSGWLPADIARCENFPEILPILCSLAPCPDDVLPATSLPQPMKWSNSSGSTEIVLSDADLVASFPDQTVARPAGRLSGTLWSIISDHPIPPHMDEYYFELDILEVCGKTKVVGIGVSRFESLSEWKFQTFPGWDNNWGYHGDDGRKFTGTAKGEKYGPTYTAGDRVGCGVDFRMGTVYFTKNGQYLGVACGGVKGQLYPTFGLGRLAKARAYFNVTPPSRMFPL